MALVVAFMVPGGRAEGAKSGKADSEARAPAPRPGETVLPKSIYLTPKSDRLVPARRLDRGPKTPPDETEPLTPEMPDADRPGEELLAEDEVLPEITVPFDPHVRPEQPAKLVPPAARNEPAKPARRQAIDVAMRDGRLRLNRFHTLKLDMAHHDCRDFPNIFIADYRLPRREIDILADNMLITQKRICAANGAIIVTCYQNKATISLRRARPGDGCDR